MRRVVPLTVVLLLLLCLSGRADEVVLKSGATFSGTVERETDEEIVIRTDIGRMRFDRSLVAEVRRSGKASAPSREESTGRVSRRIPGALATVPPVRAGAAIVVSRREGVAAYRLADLEPAWTSTEGGATVCGLAADPGGVYVATTKGAVARLDARTGTVVWRAETGHALDAAPLIHQRRIFVFGPGSGLTGIESGTGRIEGRLELRSVLDTPLASTGDRIVAGDRNGYFLVMDSDGKELLGTVDTGTTWDGGPVALALRTAVLGGRDLLSVFDPDAGRFLRRNPAPGLREHPLAADPARAYAVISGTLVAIDHVTGRTLWRSPDAGRATRATVANGSLLVTTADGRLASVSRTDGRLRWSVDLGAPAAAPPLVAGGRVFVVTKEDELLMVEEGAAAEGEDAPGDTTSPPKPEAGDGDEGPRVHSPTGFRLEIPKSWAFSESVTKGVVVLGLAPNAAAPRFLLSSASDEDRRRLSLTAYVAVVIGPRRGRSLEEMATGYLAAEKAAAGELGYGLGEEWTGTRSAGGKVWNEVRLVQARTDGSEDVRFVKRAAVRPFGEDQAVWIETRTPEIYAELVGEDFERVLAGFAPETPGEFSPPAEVVTAARAIVALETGARRELLALLAGPARKRAEAASGPPPGDLSLPLLRSTPSGAFREVRVRIETPMGTRYTSLLLSKEGGRYTIVDAGSLLP